jgi:N-methylhydantoinase B
VIVHPNLPEEREVGVSTNVFDTNGAITNLTGGGGGWGDPFKRDPEKVSIDVIDGFVSRSNAKDLYGVVFADDHGTVDVDATQILRGSMSESNS